MRLALYLLLALVVCAAPTALQYQPPPENATAVMPLEEWAGYWYGAESCSGLRSDFRQVTWYVVNTRGMGLFQCEAPTGWCVGLYRPIGHAIYIAETRIHHRNTIIHESLHALGVVGHPTPPYGVCAPVIL